MTKEKHECYDKKVVIIGANIEMNGAGIEKIMVTEEDCEPIEWSLEDFITDLQECANDMGMIDIYDTSFYIGGDFSGLSLRIDYNPDKIDDKAIDRINDYLFYSDIKFKTN